MSIFSALARPLKRESGSRGASRAVSLAVMLTAGLAVLGACAAPSGNRGVPVATYGGSSAAPTEPYTIVVRSGDSVSILAERHNVPMRALAQANGISAPYTIYKGQKLTVPVPRVHRVRNGDTLSEIALTYDTTTREVARLNNKRNPYPIYVGERLRVGGWMPDSGQNVARRQAPPVQNASATVPQPNARPARGVATPRAKPTLPAPPARAGRFLWPAEGRIISSYGPKEGGLHNDGINIRVPRGTPVVAADNGVVAYAGNELQGYGNMVLVRHQDGYVTAYAHNTDLLVSRGDIVSRGQKIAHSGSSGGVREPQIHFEVRRGSKPVNPMSYLGNNVASR
ncbi:M23 family metallopeptidase [Pyruvatibacter sp.]|uniref:M23 family metallopeptidase n=1 Tax=Pyruvatibacter sp. TaxID=1981328 RepID=UPI0032EEF5C7